jgi:predicted transcriptional regulator
MDSQALLKLTSDIVASHASANELSRDALLAEIEQVFAKLASLGGIEGVAPPVLEDLGAEEESEIVPAVPLEAAFGAERVFCMACGKGMKTPGTPLVAKNYSEARKKMAQDLNLAEGLAKARAARGKKKKKR